MDFGISVLIRGNVLYVIFESDCFDGDILFYLWEEFVGFLVFIFVLFKSQDDNMFKLKNLGLVDIDFFIRYF